MNNSVSFLLDFSIMQLVLKPVFFLWILKNGKLLPFEVGLYVLLFLKEFPV